MRSATVAMAQRKAEEGEGEKEAGVAAAFADAGDPRVHVVRVRERGVRRSGEKGGKQHARGLSGLACCLLLGQLAMLGGRRPGGLLLPLLFSYEQQLACLVSC